MSKERTQAEIDAEIKKLEACKAWAPKYNIFSENNHAKIDAQIDFLRGNIDTTADEFTIETPENIQSAIFDAEAWRNGDSDDAPASGWDNFKHKKSAKKKKK